MKSKIILLFVSFFISFMVKGQQHTLPISVGYYSPFFNHIGAQISTVLPVKQWATAASKSIFISPQVAFFMRPRIEENYLLNVEMGISTKKEHRKLRFSHAIGLGTFFNMKHIDGTVNLGTGESTRNREASLSIVPTYNFKMSTDKNKPINYYLKLFVGHDIHFSQESASFFGLELGVILSKSKITKGRK